MILEPSLIEDDYLNSRSIPTEREAITSLRTEHHTEENLWLSDNIFEPFLDDITPGQQHEILRWDIAPSREKGEETAKCLTRGVAQRLDAETETMIPSYSIQGNLIGRDAGGPQGVGVSGDGVMYTLTKADVHGVAQPIAYSFDSLASNSMKSSNPHSGCRQVELSKTLDTTTPEPSKNQGGIAVMQQMAVRRLTPTECERLQGFPDGYTNIKSRCPDGPRYKALGNSMAVPVMRWIGERINAVSKIN